MNEPIVRGPAGEPPIPPTPSTAARREAVDHRVEAALERLGGDLEPRPDWQARVLAAIEREDAPHTRWLRRWLALVWADGFAAIIALVVAAVLFARIAPDARSLAISVERVAASSCEGAREPAAGDTVRIAVRRGAGQRALRVYRDDQLIAACPGSAGCAPDAAAIVLPLDRAGTYVVLAATGLSLPRFEGGYRADRAAADTAGAEVAVHELRVR